MKNKTTETNNKTTTKSTRLPNKGLSAGGLTALDLDEEEEEEEEEDEDEDAAEGAATGAAPFSIIINLKYKFE